MQSILQKSGARRATELAEGAVHADADWGANKDRRTAEDATTLYAWYDGEQEPVKLARGAGLSTDNLAGVPTYEAILSYAKSQLTQAAFVTLDEQASDCVYVSAQDGECQQDYWVSLDSGLLCKQTMTVSGELVYLMEQTALEIFPDNDEGARRRLLPAGWYGGGFFLVRSMTAATVSKIVSVSSSSVSMSTRSSTSSTRRSPGSMPRGRSFRSGRSGRQGAG